MELLTPEERGTRVWVNCTTGEITWPTTHKIDLFSFGNLKQRLAKDWNDLFSSKLELQEEKSKKICL